MQMSIRSGGGVLFGVQKADSSLEFVPKVVQLLRKGFEKFDGFLEIYTHQCRINTLSAVSGTGA